MNPILLRILFAAFLLAHGWVHMSLAQVPHPKPGALRTPFFPAWWRSGIDTAWPVNKFGLPQAEIETFGWALWVTVVILYTLAGIAILFFPGLSALWQCTLLGGSVLSLILLALYWHPWLPAGVLIDLALIAAVLLRWPTLQ